MDNLPLNEFRRQVGEYVNQTYYASKAFILLKGERKVAALVPIALVDRLAELEAFYAQKMQSPENLGTVDRESNLPDTVSGERSGGQADEATR
ncbi:hypothetical protein JYG30_25570 (plasmid) [Fibrella sp. USSR17]